MAAVEPAELDGDVADPVAAPEDEVPVPVVLPEVLGMVEDDAVPDDPLPVADFSWTLP